MSLSQLIYECFNPSMKPVMKLEIQPKMVKVTEEDYKAILDQIKEEIYLWGNDFDIEYMVDIYTLRVYGNINTNVRDSCGDGYYTPKESIDESEIKIHGFLCYDEDGGLVSTDFDPSKI